MSSTAIAPAANNPFAGYISQIDAISIDDVVGEARLGGLNFRNAQPTIESLKDFVEQVRFLDGTAMPSRMLAKATSAFQEVLNTIQQIKNFDATNYGGNPTARQNLIQQLSSGYETLLEATVPVLLYSNFRSSGIKAAQASTYALLAEVEKRRDDVVHVVNDATELLRGKRSCPQRSQLQDMEPSLRMKPETMKRPRTNGYGLLAFSQV